MVDSTQDATWQDRAPSVPSQIALPKVPGFDVLAELGRGGMGVVYQARQLPVFRLVALKMILAGDFAHPEQMLRFIIEGETLGRLQHPNIVQVHEVGQHERRPYLVLEYVDGGTLQDCLQLTRLEPRRAAQLTEQLARAVHHAHLQGVIHRDLKPANVLLQEDKRPEAAGSFIPKIADFGLARSLHIGPVLTVTGLVAGTPNYMAPEQARGEKNLGPGVDIHALGAMLYEMLAGRPPFDAATVMETLRATIDIEAPRPSTLRPGVPADLETICLKCLEKEPARRYPSAEALADDLRRWQDGEPIRARPVSAFERAWKWSRRRPALAGSLAASATLLMAIALISSVSAVRLRQQRDAILAEQQRATRAEEAHKLALADAILSSAPGGVPLLKDSLASSSELVLPSLRRRFNDTAEAPQRRLRAAIALTILGEPQADFLVAAVPQAPASECSNLSMAFQAMRSPEMMDRLLRRAQGAPDIFERVRWGVLLLDLGDLRAARALLAPRADPTTRTAFIDAFRSWCGGLASLPPLLESCGDAECRSGLCAALGNVEPSALLPEFQHALAAVLSHWYVSAPDGGTHSAAGWALRQWGLTLPELEMANRPSKGRQWFVNSTGLTMLRVPFGAFVLDEAVMLVTRPAFMSDREISVGLFRRFLDDPAWPANQKPARWSGPDASISPSDDCPVDNFTQQDAIWFCNWLSAREGRKPCYQVTAAAPQSWKCDFKADGYRLPTEAEWDQAHRAGATTTFFFGNDPRWLSAYAHVGGVRTLPCGSKLPNRWGFFDLLGNLWEMCWDYAGPLPRGVMFDPAGPATGSSWIWRGGAYDSGSYDCRLSRRYGSTAPASALGFRVACGK
jgi:serine/threonine protein kinase/formylglycine-generating enzyme required for sulfatase activity